MAFRNGKYIINLKFQLENKSPFNIGDDEGMPIITLEENQVYLPGTTLAGAFKDYLTKCNEKGLEEDFGELGEQSNIFFMDSYAPLKNIEIRDAVCIDRETGTSANKFSRVYVSAEHKFNVNIKIFGENKLDLDNRYNKILSCLKAINDEEIVLGAYKSSGAGSFKVNEVLKEDFSFENKNDIFKYLLNEDKYEKVDINKFTNSKKEENLFKFQLTGMLKTSILVKGHESLDADKVDSSGYVNGKGEYIIPGTSLKGVIRSESERILKYLNYDNNEIIDVFGGSIESGCEKKNFASKLRVQDSTINKVRSKIYNRIKIDKFTAKTIQGALFNEEVLSGELKINATLRTDDKKFVGLIGMIFRDVALGKISIGSGNNVGRGRIAGKELIVTEGNNTLFKWNLENDKVEVNKIDSFINKLVGREN